nr:hypothetical protein [Tanacetum cinerariifolium]
MKEMVNKFIEVGKREHEETEAFIREFQTTNELLLKERNNSLSELEFEVYGLSRAINKACITDREVKDLGASIILMPYTMYEKVENILIKIDKFFLPIDFVILDMREDSRIPIILGRPFLAMIDVFNKKITPKVGSEEVIFNVDQSIKRPPAEDDERYGIDYFDLTIHLKTHELLEDGQLDSFLVQVLYDCSVELCVVNVDLDYQQQIQRKT